MLKELLDVMKLVRPRHLLKAVLHPIEELQALKYHYRRVSVERFVLFLSGPLEDLPVKLKAAEMDLRSATAFHAGLKERLRLHADGYGDQMTKEAPALYCLIRLLKPRVVVETGVADGFTSAHILRALEDNGEGRLYSIDLPNSKLPPDKGPGWIVEGELRKRWDLRIGDAKTLLPPLLDELGEVDLFLHDSLHTYEHMTFEYRAAWPRVKPGGLFLSHDVGQNAAFFDFMAEAGIRWRDYRVFHVLGGFRKPAVGLTGGANQ